MKNANHFVNWYFDRFLDSVMSKKIRSNFWHMLSHADMYAIKDKDRWIADASLEEKLMLLSKLGHPFALVIGVPQKRPAKLQIERMVSIFFRLLTWKRKDAVTVMRQRHFFVMSDMDFVKGLKLASHVFNSPAGVTLAGMSAVTQKMYQYKMDVQKQMVRDQAAAVHIDSIILQAMNLTLMQTFQDGFKNLYGISEKQYMILAILSRVRQATLKQLHELTGGMRFLPTHTKALLDQRMIENKFAQYGTKAEYQYWITGLGEQVLIKARNYFIQHL